MIFNNFFKNLKIFLFTFISVFIFLLFINSVSSTLEIPGANDYHFSFDPDTIYQISNLDAVNPASGTFMIENNYATIKGINNLNINIKDAYSSGVWINRIDGDDYDDNVGQLQEFSHLGVGWKPLSFGILRLTYSSQGSNVYLYPEGSYVDFGDGNQYRIYINETGTGYLIKDHKNWALKVVPSGNPNWPDYEIIKEDGITYFYDGNSCFVYQTEANYWGTTYGSATSKYCTVSSITDTHQNSIDIHYMPVPTGVENNLLPQNHWAIDYIEDSLGRQINFDYNIINNDQYATLGQYYAIDHYLIDKIKYDNANGDEITIDYTIDQVDVETEELPYAHHNNWVQHTYLLSKVEIKKVSQLLEPSRYYYYNDYGELNEVIYKDTNQMTSSPLTEDVRVKYYYDKVKNQYSNLAPENVAGYSSRLVKKETYNGLGDIAVWEYKYGVNDVYYDGNSGSLTQRTFLHCDDNTNGNVTNCATNINTGRIGPVETGGTVLNFYKQVKIINPDDSYNVNYYYGNDNSINALDNLYGNNNGWPIVRDSAGTIKEIKFYTSDNVLLNKKAYDYNFLNSNVGTQNRPNNNNYRSRLREIDEYRYDESENSILIKDEYGTYSPVGGGYDEYDNLKLYVRSYYDDSYGYLKYGNWMDYLHETNNEYEDANILNKVESDKQSLGGLGFCGYLFWGSIGLGVSETDYQYDEDVKGDLIEERQVSLDNIDPDSVTEYSYDYYGNVLTMNDPNNNNFDVRYINNAYPGYGWNDAYGSENSPVWEKNYLNNGFIESEDDKNGNLIEYYYDDLDRVIKVVEDGDSLSEPTLQYVYSDFSSNVKEIVKLDDDNYVNRYYFYDGLGKLIQIREPKDNNVLVASTKYDELGNKIYVSEKYLESGQASLYSEPDWTNLINQNKVTQYEYDELNRVIKKINTDLTFSEIKYGPNWKLVEDEKGVKTLYRYDNGDRIMEVEENYIECTNGNTKPCPLEVGVCSSDEQTCSNGVWPEVCNYVSKEDSENYDWDCNDNLDNDCDGLVDDDDPDCTDCDGNYGQSYNFCIKQTGVCEGKEGSMSGVFVSSPYNYHYYYCTDNDYGVNYQRREVSCSDNLDNDCDGLVDNNDYDCSYSRILTQYSYDRLNNLVRVVDSVGKATEKYYDSFGRLKYSVNYDKGLVEYGYDSKGNVVYKITNNVLKNSNFERENEFWTFDSGVSLDSNSYFGENSVKASGDYKYANQYSYILGSQKYILSLYSKAESKNLGVIIYLYDKYGNEIDPDSVSIGTGWSPGCGADHHCWYSGSIPVEEQYSRIILPYFNTPNNAHSIKMGIGASGTGTGYIYIDTVQLEKGTEAKPYSLTEYEYNEIDEVIETGYPGLNMMGGDL